LPEPKVQINLVSVWDIEEGTQAEELEVYYYFPSFVNLQQVILTSEHYPEIEISLPTALLQDPLTKEWKGGVGSLRFSWFAPLLPRGLYILNFKGDASQGERASFYIEESPFRGEKPFFEQEGKVVLKEGFVFQRREKGAMVEYLTQEKGKTLLIKGKPLSFQTD
jgi:hypothetical protein